MESFQWRVISGCKEPKFRGFNVGRELRSFSQAASLVFFPAATGSTGRCAPLYPSRLRMVSTVCLLSSAGLRSIASDCSRDPCRIAVDPAAAEACLRRRGVRWFQPACYGNEVFVHLLHSEHEVGDALADRDPEPLEHPHTLALVFDFRVKLSHAALPDGAAEVIHREQDGLSRPSRRFRARPCVSMRRNSGW